MSITNRDPDPRPGRQQGRVQDGAFLLDAPAPADIEQMLRLGAPLLRRDSGWSDSGSAVVPLGAAAGGGYGSNSTMATMMMMGYGGGKFPPIEVPDFPAEPPRLFLVPPDSAAADASPVTLSPASSSSRSRTWSSVSASDCAPSRSRNPSPLRNAVAETAAAATAAVGSSSSSEHACAAPRCGARFRRREDLDAHASSGHAHACLWGSSGPCDSAGFPTREALNWHVKSEHLLECPVAGCAESAFASRDLLDCHVRWGHGVVVKTAGETAARQLGRSLDGRDDYPAAMVPAAPLPASNSAGEPRSLEKKTIMERSSDAGEESLKVEMSIGISKKRCKEQMRAAVEKKLKKTNGGTPKAVDSPGASSSRAPKLLESASFPLVWEHGVLPFLAEFLPKWCGAGHAISVTRGRKPGARRVCIMTRQAVTTARRMVIASHVRDLLPETYRDAVSFVFSTGEVDRLVWARGLGGGMLDEVCLPRNPFAYISPCMGDSIGVALDSDDEGEEEEITATLGPCVTFGGDSYWLANFHPFVDASRKSSRLMVEHPSPADRARCSNEGHDALDNDCLNPRVGELVAKSGFNLSTTRVSHDPYWEECGKDPPLVVMDWALISANTRQANLLRKFPSAAQPSTTQHPNIPIKSLSPVIPGAPVVSTGRTSGLQRGQVCEVPAYVDGRENGTGKATREWFVEQHADDAEDEGEDAWIRGGVGVSGDSGAAIVVDGEAGALVGQLWGRNRYHGPGPRVAYFTPLADVFDDVQEKCDQAERPRLPQYRDEADRWPAYPLCRPCYDLREYLDSRRSSRESLLSMIGVAGGRSSGGDHDHDHDLTSVSELATPKDHSHLVRHAGLDETASSLSGVVSPAPIHAFYSAAQAASSPRVAELQSPYAQALSEDDLYEPGCPGASDVVLGKRSAVPLPAPAPALLMRSGSQQAGKRRKFT